MNKRYYEHTLPIIRGSLSNTYNYRGMPCVVRDDHRLFFQDVSFEGNVPVMVVHLPFQFLSWRGNGAESREVASARPEAEPVDVRMIRLSQEKEIPDMADGGQDIHVVEISFFRNLTERGAEGLQVDAYHLADGISGHGCEVRVLFPVPQFLQCLMMVVAVYSVRHGGHAAAVKTA